MIAAIFRLVFHEAECPESHGERSRTTGIAGFTLAMEQAINAAMPSSTPLRMTLFVGTVEKAFHHTPKRFGFVMPVKTGRWIHI
jgi:hypothetical protein